MKSARQRMVEQIHEKYREHRGAVVRKYRDFFGRYVLVIEEKGELNKVRVGKYIYLDTVLGDKLTVGVMDGKLINIRPGIRKNTDH